MTVSETALSVLVKQYAIDLRRNASGGDDYPYEYAKATADYLEELIKRAKGNCTCAQAGFPDSCDNCDGLAPTAQGPISFMAAMDIVEAGFNNWKGKAHNAKWWRRIDGTPIPNDLMVNIAEAISRSTLADTSTLRECDDGGPCYLPECSAHGCMHGSDSSPEGKDHA